ncbi:MAG: hypothetical protein M1825_003611 [Sarcosagium campestre]|nr:MAG: hypothetical protein M1825_003611 [Sarcosagium campestre]
MKYLVALFLLCMSSTVVSEPFDTFFSQKPLVGTLNKPVPGDSPLELCAGAEDGILKIDYVNLTPNPPQAGNSLKIEASGTLSEDVEEGAYVNLVVKYGIIKLLDTRADVCNEIKNVDLECPLKKGETVVTKKVDLPKTIPPGKYSVFADVYTKDDKAITCLSAEVTFSPT